MLNKFGVKWQELCIVAQIKVVDELNSSKNQSCNLELCSHNLILLAYVIIWNVRVQSLTIWSMKAALCAEAASLKKNFPLLLVE